MPTHSMTRAFLAGISILALALAGCSSGTGDHANPTTSTPATAASTSATASTQHHGTIHLVYVEWDSCVAGTDLLKGALEQAGYTVKTTSVTAAMMFEGLANGDADAMVCAWLPTTHKAYYAKTKDRLVEVAANLEGGATIGLVVPDYVTIKSIADLAKPDIAKKMDNRIIGIDPGAGEMELTQKVIQHYKLPEKLIDGSDATMTAELGNQIRQHKWVVVTGWNPHWMWSRWHLRYLEDPDGVYGQPESIYTLARKGLKQEHPNAYAILSRFRRTLKDTDQIMNAANQPGNSIEKAATAWLHAHPQQVAQWLGD
ncbi:MAG TPA: glycine betaine ABC transporter substrate-binding protein [Rhodanobacteraceae bacterium]|nr:glycine betaine ABC transporter substrate-binding protein [Rhodanobacteraceae bacterium]